MITKRIALERPERCARAHTIPREKLEAAAAAACEKLRGLAEKNGSTVFPGTCSVDKKYVFNINNNWECGMYTGCYWLAYLLTGDEFFRRVAEEQTDTYRRRIDELIGMDDHDVGFVFTPACVAQYRVTGDENARDLALRACEYFYEHSYSKEGKFIIRDWKWWRDKGDVASCRTMMDSLMNAPLLFWASKETGDPKYRDAAIDHVKTTNKYLIRSDASSYHHYQFDPATAGPVGGVTWQGNRDESCWSRGHSWGIYGLPIAYSYTGLDFIPDLYKDITYYMLNHLPDDLIPYWDYDFISGDEPRDSSAAVIAVCGMHEMNRHTPDREYAPIFRNAAARMLDNVIDICTADIGVPFEGLIHHVTHAKPQGRGIDQCAVYGDYFYLDALLRYTKPDYKMYW